VRSWYPATLLGVGAARGVSALLASYTRRPALHRITRWKHYAQNSSPATCEVMPNFESCHSYQLRLCEPVSEEKRLAYGSQATSRVVGRRTSMLPRCPRSVLCTNVFPRSESNLYERDFVSEFDDGLPYCPKTRMRGIWITGIFGQGLGYLTSLESLLCSSL
jgi:hypothetical protein